MLGVYAFAAIFVVLALGLFFIAIRGGLHGAREALHVQSHGARRATGLFLTAAYIGFGVVLPVLLLTGNHSKANAQVGGVKLTAGEQQGRELFGQHCAVCHTLAASNAVGKVGPNLDTLKPPTELVLNTINNGCLENPPSQNSPEACLGFGTMPADVVEGREAQEVANYVAKVAGKE